MFCAEIVFATPAIRPRADVAYCIHALVKAAIVEKLKSQQYVVLGEWYVSVCFC